MLTLFNISTYVEIMKHIEATANQFSTLGDVDRLSLVVSLIDGPKCVGTLSDEFGVGMSTISQRLKILYQARLVTKERRGKHMFYAIADHHVRSLIENDFEHAGE